MKKQTNTHKIVELNRIEAWEGFYLKRKLIISLLKS